MLEEYEPCSRCGSGNTETINQKGGILCEPCHNATSCGCETCLEEAPLEVGKEKAK
jgi:hypothetical protein